MRLPPGVEQHAFVHCFILVKWYKSMYMPTCSLETEKQLTQQKKSTFTRGCPTTSITIFPSLLQRISALLASHGIATSIATANRFFQENLSLRPSVYVHTFISSSNDSPPLAAPSANALTRSHIPRRLGDCRMPAGDEMTMTGPRDSDDIKLCEGPTMMVEWLIEEKDDASRRRPEAAHCAKGGRR